MKNLIFKKLNVFSSFYKLTLLINMSGHSKWSTIKHRKGALDTKRGNLFTKLTKNISVAAKEGGSDIETNLKLKVWIAKAKEANMPKDNIERAIKKGTGELEGVTYEECVYEGFGPAGSAMIVECITDNTNRTVQEIKTIFNKNGGNIGTPNSVMWMFDQIGLIEIEKNKISLSGDDIELFFMDLGVESYEIKDDKYELYVLKDDLHKISKIVATKVDGDFDSKLFFLAKDFVDLNSEGMEKLEKLVTKLEEHDDVNNVYLNAN